MSAPAFPGWSLFAGFMAESQWPHWDQRKLLVIKYTNKIRAHRKVNGRKKDQAAVGMKVLYVDDEKKALDEFVQCQAVNGISVECLQDIHQLRELLEARPRKELPDLIVTDLYRTRAELGTSSAAQINQQVDALVLEIAASRQKLATLVALEKEPAGIAALTALRSSPKLVDIPVIICTREGLNLVDDALLRLSLSLGADWMIKGRSPEVIRELMLRKVAESTHFKKRIKRDVVLMVVGSVLGAVLGYLVSWVH